MPGLHVHDSGDGPAVLLLHAFPLDGSMWDHQVAAWSGRYRCLRPDAWGCGVSGPPPAGASLDGLADALLTELDSRGVDRFAITGCSMGGYLAMALLRRAPERVRALVLVSTHARADGDAGRADRLAMAERVRRDGSPEAIVTPMLSRLLSERARDEPHIADPVAGRIRRCTAEGVAVCQEMMAARPDSHDVLRAVRIPALVVRGDADPIVDEAMTGELCAALAGSRRERFEAAGHLLTLEEPKRFGDVAGGFLDEVLRPADS